MLLTILKYSEWPVSQPGDCVWRVEKAFRAAVGDRAESLMHRRSRHIANLTLLAIARDPHGARIVMAKLDNIIRQARDAGRDARSLCPCKDTHPAREPERESPVTPPLLAQGRLEMRITQVLM